jgi:hypothetical protein
MMMMMMIMYTCNAPFSASNRFGWYISIRHLYDIIKPLSFLPVIDGLCVVRCMP